MDKRLIDMAKYRLERAKQDLSDAEYNYKGKRYLNANNRAYYSIFHAIRAVLSTEGVDFKKHKSVIAYFNEHYVSTEIFPKKMGKRISQANKIREDSDYDYKFIVKPEETVIQIETARELIKLVEEYINKLEMSNG